MFCIPHGNGDDAAKAGVQHGIPSLDTAAGARGFQSVGCRCKESKKDWSRGGL